ncbi:MAG: hypothetical protein GWP10_05150 [Nitrospiraceae bacterium]|nr:hypothetical protein [Nitrospiraceae bacterium]
MEVVCKNCGRHYKIADNKLPAKGTAYFTCPNCKERIEVKTSPPKNSLTKAKKRRVLFDQEALSLLILVLRRPLSTALSLK